MSVEGLNAVQSNYTVKISSDSVSIGAIKQNAHNIPEQSKLSLETELNGQELMEKLKSGCIDMSDMSLPEKALIQAIEKANKAVDGITTTFEYSIHEKTHEIVVKVINRDTNEVIREIPPEKTLDMVAKMWELAGLFVDEKR